MSNAMEAFERGMKDAKSLITRFDESHKRVPHDESEVLKRAALVMIAAAWETYIEDRLREAVLSKFGPSEEDAAAQCIHGLLERDLSTLHNPTAEKVTELAVRYLQLDVTKAWKVPPRTPEQSRTALNDWLRLRGDSIHRTPRKGHKVPVAHMVHRSDLEKAMRFFRALANATESALATA
jgi:hypothetical protein